MPDRLPAHPVEAALLPEGARWTLRMTRELAHEPDRVWTALTDRAELARWAPFAPDRDLDAPGEVRLPLIDDPEGTDETARGRVVEVDPPRVLALLWGSDLLRFLLTPANGGTSLVLAHTFDERGAASSYAAGWHLCLAALADLLDGLDLPPVVGTAAMEHGWPELNQRYAMLFSRADTVR